MAMKKNEEGSDTIRKLIYRKIYDAELAEISLFVLMMTGGLSILALVLSILLSGPVPNQQPCPVEATVLYPQED